VKNSDKIDFSALGVTVANLVINNAGGALFNVTHTASSSFLIQVQSNAILTTSDFILA
jgi:hypothetical protein